MKKGNLGAFKLWHFLVVTGLLGLPGLALYRSLGLVALLYAGGWCALISGLTYLIYALDKRRARSNGQREPENHLHLLELLGGWPGAFLAQRQLRHKSVKGSYQFIFILIIGLHQFLAIEALREWPFVKLIAQFLKNAH